jgi:hypothetical protein
MLPIDILLNEDCSLKVCLLLTLLCGVPCPA